MRFHIVVGLVVLGLAGLASSVALGHYAHQLSCSVNSGAVDGYHVTAKHCHTPVTVGAPIYRVDTLKTSLPSGTFDFHTAYLAQCHQGPGAADVIMPSAGVAILHLAGTTWCRHLITNPKTWLTTKNARILITGTLVGLTSSSKGSLIQVVEGTAVVSPPSQVKKIVPRGTQLFVPSTGLAGKPTALVLTPIDQQTVLALQQNVIQMGAPQAAEHLQSRAEKSAVIVGDTLDSARKEAALLPNVRVALLTADQVRAKPAVVASQMEQLGAHSVITVGAFNTIEPAWVAMRGPGTLPPGTAIVYATP